MTHPADVELLVSGISPLRDGITEKQRLELPVRFKMFISQTETAHFEVSGQPVTGPEFALALEMAKVKQLDRIADVLEVMLQQQNERGRRQ